MKDYNFGDFHLLASDNLYYQLMDDFDLHGGELDLENHYYSDVKLWSKKLREESN